MDPLLASLLAVGIAAVPVLFGLYAVHMKNGINADAFASVCIKLLDAGNPERFEKLLHAGEMPLMRLIRFVWEHRHVPEAAAPSFEGYRGVERAPSYLERLGPIIKPEVARVRAGYLKAWLWTTPAFATLPVLFVLGGSPRANAPWVIAGVMCLASLVSLITMMGQRGDVHSALAQLAPYFERYAGRD